MSLIAKHMHILKIFGLENKIKKQETSFKNRVKINVALSIALGGYVSTIWGPIFGPFGSKLAPSWLKLAPNWPQVGSKLAPSWLKVGPSWVQVGS